MRHSSRRSAVLTALAIAACVGTVSYPSHATSGAAVQSADRKGQGREGTAPSAGSAKSARRYDEYRIPAGTALPIELRTPLSSNVSRPADVVEGRLQRAITSGEVELVPAGAAVFGTVTAADAAAPGTAGRLAFAFTVIEHPDTGSRAMIRTTGHDLRTEVPRRGKPLPEIALPRGTDASVTLLQPLPVRIPEVDAAR